MKVITMTAYRRPEYTREVLEALAQCDGIGDWTLLPNVEPGNAEVIAASRDFHACACRLVVNERRIESKHPRRANAGVSPEGRTHRPP